MIYYLFFSVGLRDGALQDEVSDWIQGHSKEVRSNMNLQNGVKEWLRRRHHELLHKMGSHIMG